MDSHKHLGEVLIDMGLVSSERLKEILARQNKIPRLKAEDYVVNENLFELVPRDLIRDLKVIPISQNDSKISIASLNPFDKSFISEIEKKINASVDVHYILEKDFEAIMDKIRSYEESKI
jgi:type IV pilus assembly protein PilB